VASAFFIGTSTYCICPFQGKTFYYYHGQPEVKGGNILYYDIKYKLPYKIGCTPSLDFLISFSSSYSPYKSMLADIFCASRTFAHNLDVEIPEDITREMQSIDLKKIYDELPDLIEEKQCSTVRKLAGDFPVFENDKLSSVAVFNEVLFLANEGKVRLRQMRRGVKVITGEQV